MKAKNYLDMSPVERQVFFKGVLKRAQKINNRNKTSYRNISQYNGELYASPIMVHYASDENGGLCIEDCKGSRVNIDGNIQEVHVFLYNCINAFPFISPLLKRLRNLETWQSIQASGFDHEDRKKEPPKPRKIAGRLGRPQVKDSKRQKILRGELSYYEAYHKNKEDDDNLEDVL